MPTDCPHSPIAIPLPFCISFFSLLSKFIQSGGVWLIRIGFSIFALISSLLLAMNSLYASQCSEVNTLLSHGDFAKKGISFCDCHLSCRGSKKYRGDKWKVDTLSNSKHSFV